jgi:hypothetical protein
MKFIADLLRRALLLLVTGFVSVMVAACYGMFYGFQTGGRVVDHDTGDPIPAIQVKCIGESGAALGVAYTDAEGYWQLEVGDDPNVNPCAAWEFMDVDGEVHGGDHADVRLAQSLLHSGDVVEMDLE